MQANSNIEKILESHEHRKPQENYFTRFCALRGYLLNQVYPQVMAGFPGGNDHGPNHITRVLEYLDGLIGSNSSHALDVYELFIAMMAVLWHDVGIIQGRKEHADKSSLILRLDGNDFLFNNQDKHLIEIAVTSHSSSADIEEKCKAATAEQIVRGHKIRIRLVTALVRLADELDEDVRRAEPSLFRIAALPEESKFYWEFSQRILGVFPDPIRKQISFNISLQKEDLNRIENNGGSKQTFIERFFEKILKINRERKLCSHHFPDAIKYDSLLLTINPIPSVGNVHPMQIIVDDNSSLNSILGQLDPSFTRPSGIHPTTKLSRLIVTGHSYLEGLPVTVLSVTASSRTIAEKIESEYHVKPELVVNSDRRLIIWLRMGNCEVSTLKSLFFGVAGLVSSLETVETIEIGCSDTRDLINRSSFERIATLRIIFDRRQIYHLIKHQEMADDYLSQISVDLLRDENSVDMGWQSVPLTEFK